jgi:hypothetical protein
MIGRPKIIGHEGEFYIYKITNSTRTCVI